MNGKKVIITKSVRASEASRFPKPSNPVEIVWERLQLAPTILPVSICTFFTKAIDQVHCFQAVHLTLVVLLKHPWHFRF
jgi:hypothetical protein